MAKKKKPKEPPRTKVGKCWYVCGYDGKPKIGLSWDKATGYFFPTHYKQTDDFKKSGKHPLFSKNYDTALGLFGFW